MALKTGELSGAVPLRCHHITQRSEFLGRIAPKTYPIAFKSDQQIAAHHLYLPSSTSLKPLTTC